MATISSYKELRVILYSGHLMFVNASPDMKYRDFRTFSFNKLRFYSALISETYQEHGRTPELVQGCTEDDQIADEIPGVVMETHYNQTIGNAWWRRLFFWEFAFKPNYSPGFDEPFRELLIIIEKLDDESSSLDPHGDQIPLPEINGVTVNLSILRHARLLWATKHLRLCSRLGWETKLRCDLMQAINDVNTVSTTDNEPAFRAVDFWYIWGAFRGLDDELVEAMVAKLHDAMAHNTDPKDLAALITEGAELKTWLEKAEQKKAKMTWAQQLGGMSGRRIHVPSPLNLSKPANLATGPKTEIYIPPAVRNGSKLCADPPKTAVAAPVTILRRNSVVSIPAETTVSEDKKYKGVAYTAPTGMAPPPPPSAKGSSHGGKKKRGNFGSNRGKGSLSSLP